MGVGLAVGLTCFVVFLFAVGVVVWLLYHPSAPPPTQAPAPGPDAELVKPSAPPAPAPLPLPQQHAEPLVTTMEQV